MRTVTQVLTLPQWGCNRFHGNETADPTPPPEPRIPTGQCCLDPPTRRSGQALGPARGSLPRPMRRRPNCRWLPRAASGEPALLLIFGDIPMRRITTLALAVAGLACAASAFATPL